MTQAKKDNNNVDTMLAVLQSDGVTPSLVKADPTNHTMAIDDDTTGTDQSANEDARRDQNMVTTLVVASEVDGVSPVLLYVDADGQLLIDSN